MCYICNSSSGHEASCPFAPTEVKYLRCRECGEEIPSHEACDKDSDTCLCYECYHRCEDDE